MKAETADSNTCYETEETVREVSSIPNEFVRGLTRLRLRVQ